MVKALLLIARWIAKAHDRWCASTATRRPLAVEVAVLKERLERAHAENDLLRARLERIEPRRRPHYRPWERLNILWHQARYRLSNAATAKAFMVSLQALVNWHRDAAKIERTLVEGRTPLERASDLVGALVVRLKAEWPSWGSRRVAGILARLGVAASRSTVQRILRRPRAPAPTRNAVRRRHGPLVPKRAKHIWFLDFTRVGSVLRSVHVGAVVDGFSRKVLAIAVAPHEPSARFAVTLLREAIRRYGPPTWIVTDHGTQFTAHLFMHVLSTHGIRRRYGAVGRKGSISIIERFWRSMKAEHAHGLSLFCPLPHIRARLRAYATWFNAHRPHQGLGQRTPDEVFTGRSRPPVSLPLRARLDVEHLDGNRDLPILRLRRAA
jgi:putative transposase